jgi:hypothetical protein
MISNVKRLNIQHRTAPCRLGLFIIMVAGAQIIVLQIFAVRAWGFLHTLASHWNSSSDGEAKEEAAARRLRDCYA